MIQPTLLDGETLPTITVDGETSIVSDESINEKYTKGEVRIVTEQARYPLNSIPAMIASGDYFLQPSYQRRHRWSSQKKSALIESFVMNVPIPPVFLYEYEYSKYEVMDGLQRLSTITDFYDDRFDLVDLVQWPELNGRHYSSLPESVRAGIDRRYLSSIILLRETAKSSIEADALKQLVFERINSGGEKLTPQESRNAIHPGPMNTLCLELSRRESLCLTWQIPPPTEEELLTGEPDEALLENPAYREMADVELVLRFFAYRQNTQNLHGALRNYFDYYQRVSNGFDPLVLEGLRDLFEQTVDFAYELFGERAFWLWRLRNDKWNWMARPTVAAYDTIMCVLSQHLDMRASIMAARAKICHDLPQFYETNYEDFSARYTNPRNVERRRELLEGFLLSEIG